MRLLLDTHVWLWTLVEPHRIRDDVRERLSVPGTTLHLSAASTWEIAIKYRLGKLPLPEPPERFVLPRLVRDGIRPLPIEPVHTLRVATLPDHHADPFDRLLVAQAQVERFTIVTADAKLAPYDVSLLMAV